MDGTRTWITAHAVERDPEKSHEFDDFVLERRIAEKVNAGKKNGSKPDKVWQPKGIPKPTKKAKKVYRKRLRDRAMKDLKRKK